MKFSKTITYDVFMVDDKYYYKDEDGFVVRSDNPTDNGFEVVDNAMSVEDIEKERYGNAYYKIIHQSGLMDEGYQAIFINDSFLQFVKSHTEDGSQPMDSSFGVIINNDNIILLYMSLDLDVPDGLAKALNNNLEGRSIVTAKFNSYVVNDELI